MLLRDKIWHQRCCLLAFYIVVPGPAMICESITAPFLTFVPHGKQTIEETEFFSSRWRDRSARNTSASIGNVFPFLCGAVNVFGCYPSSLKFPNCFKTTNTQSAIVWHCRFFWLPSSTWGRFFRCCLIHLTDFSLFRKGHVLHFTEKQKCLSFPNHHWTEWMKLHTFNDNTANFAWR